MTATVSTSSFWIAIEPIVNELLRPDAKSVVRGSDPQVSVARLWRRKLSANDVIRSVDALACLTGRKAMRSIARASATTISRTSGISNGAGSGISTTAYAPSMTSSPWAKLTSRMIPKMTATPSANSA